MFQFIAPEPQKQPPSTKSTIINSPVFKLIVAPLFVIIVPIIIYFSYLTAYGVNVPFGDDWELVPIVQSFNTGHLQLAQLWTQHNENRMLVPNIIFMFLYHLTAFDTKAAMFVGAALTAMAFLLLAFIFIKRHGPNLWALAPLSFIFFSLSANQNILWGFQVAWHLVILCLFGAILCLEQSGENQLAFITGLILAVLASFSSLQGLFIWPIGVIYLFLNDFNRKQKIAWNAAMILSFIFYFIGFNFYSTGGPSISYGLFHPANAFQYSLVLIGSVFPPSSPRWGDLFTREVIGAFLFVLSGFILVQARKRVVLEKPLLAPLALMMFAFLFDASITIGRAAFGLIQAPSSRYTSANLVLMISIYLLLFHFLKTEQGSAQKKNASRLFYFYLLILGCQFAISLRQGMDMGKDLFQKRTAAQELLINYEIGAPELIARYLYPHPNILRRRAAVLERSHSNVFSTWIGNALLPIPKTLGPLLKKDRASLLAWRLLSTVYFFRADLQKRYPPTPEVEDFISKIAAWAVEYGLTRDKDREFLWPGKKQLIKINEILHPADQTKKS